MIRQCPMQTHSNLHHTYLATSARDAGPSARGSALQTKGRGKAQPDRDGRTPSKGANDGLVQQGGKGMFHSSGDREAHCYA